MGRIERIAIRLIAQLEDLYVHKEVDPEIYLEDRYDGPTLARHQKVVGLRKTKEKLERWFAAREIPIRIVYTDPNRLSVIPKPGVITFMYESMTLQDPPTAWMIVHNLAHGIFDYIKQGGPHLLQNQVGTFYQEGAQKQIGEMGLSPSRDPRSDSGKGHPDTTYPITRSALLNEIPNSSEAFYELFSQWVTTGRIRLHSYNHPHARQWERRLTQYFREVVDDVAALGVVVRNV